jgi:hypothetical protein
MEDTGATVRVKYSSTTKRRLRPVDTDAFDSLQQQIGWGAIHPIPYEDPTTLG